MKITKTQLKQIIREEISRVLLKESKGKVLNRAEWKELLDRVKSKKQKTMSRDWTDRSRDRSRIGNSSIRQRLSYFGSSHLGRL